jgi:hypothetical protein
MNVISELRKRVFTPAGKFTPGSVSRIAEYLDCNRRTVRNCIIGHDESGTAWSFSAPRIKKLERMITLGIPLSRKKPGPKTPALAK